MLRNVNRRYEDRRRKGTRAPPTTAHDGLNQQKHQLTRMLMIMWYSVTLEVKRKL